ncbi:hypothetical protein Tco_1562572 [Tanacetum coccineum]
MEGHCLDIKIGASVTCREHLHSRKRHGGRLTFRMGVKETTMGSRTGVVIGSDHSEVGRCCLLCEQEGALGPLYLGYWLHYVEVGNGVLDVITTWYVIPFKSSFGLVTVLPGRVPEPEVEGCISSNKF